MIHLKGKKEFESIELKRKLYEKQKKNNNSKNIQIIIFFLIMFFCLFVIISFILYKKVSNNYQAKLLEKNNKLEKIQKKLNDLKIEQKTELKKRQTEKEQRLTHIDKEYIYDINFYKQIICFLLKT